MTPDRASASRSSSRTRSTATPAGRAGRRAGRDAGRARRRGRRPGRADVVQPPGVDRGGPGDLAAGRGGGAVQPGLEAGGDRARAGDHPPAHAVGDHPVLAGPDADAEPRRADRADRADRAARHRADRPRIQTRRRSACSCSAPAPPGCRRRSATPTGRCAAAIAHWRDALELTRADRMQVTTPPSHILGLLNIATALELGIWMRLHRRFDLDRMLQRDPGRPDHGGDGGRADRARAGRTTRSWRATTCPRCASSCGARRR